MNKSEDSKKENSKSQPGKGLRSLDTTSLFRITNFELFAKPNKAVMIFGLFMFTCCAGYIAYMRKSMTTDKTYIALDEDGNQVIRMKQSRWD